jgi:hypothetical protein
MISLITEPFAKKRLSRNPYLVMIELPHANPPWFGRKKYEELYEA